MQHFVSSFWPWFPALNLGHLHNCCIINLTPMSVGQTTLAIPRLMYTLISLQIAAKSYYMYN